MKAAAKRIGMEVLGWVLLVVGLLAIPLPGPGVLITAGALVILSQQYEWAERRVEPMKREALKGAAKSVETWPRVIVTSTMITLIAAAGVLWFVHPAAPSWWPISDRWWLPGGKATAISQFLSALIALALLVWSYRRYHGDPEAIAEVVAAAKADDDREHFWGE